MLWLGVLISVSLIAILAISTGGKGKTKKALSTGLVTGVIMGTLVGGSSTIGTAQLAFTFGASAWWFTLGAGISCLILAFIYTDALRRENGKTITGIIAAQYGARVGTLASVLNSLGTFINILVQLIAATAVIAVICPWVSLWFSLIFSAAFMTLYVIFGGTRGSGIVGLLKLALIYFSILACCAIVLANTDGLGGFVAMVETISASAQQNFFSLFGRGIAEDLGACLSMIVGITTTQIYAQALTSAQNNTSARLGAAISALLIAIIGLGGIMVGLYMRAHHPDIDPKCALTEFVLLQMPDLLAGLVLGTLFITVIGTGAGLSLGVATLIQKDLLSHRIKNTFTIDSAQVLQRFIIAFILVSAAFCCLVLESDLILGYSYLSMALRGTVVFAPLIAALWFKGQVKPEFVMASTLLGPLLVIALKPFDLGINPLFISLAVTFIVVALGRRVRD